MIINPDGALIITLILNIILAWVVSIVLYKKKPNGIGVTYFCCYDFYINFYN